MFRRDRIKNVKGLGVIVMQCGRLWYVRTYMLCAALPAEPGLPNGPASVCMYGIGIYSVGVYTELTVLGALLQKQITLSM